MKLIYILPLVFMTAACNNKIGNNSTECKEYIQTVKKNWPDKSDGYRQLASYETIWNENKNCLLGISKKEIRKIFGEPDQARGNQFLYYLKKECTLPKNNQGGCVTLKFTFGQQDKVFAIPEPIIWPHNQQ